MAHIEVPDNLPGILGPMAISPATTKALRELVEVLLRGSNTLTPGEREIIATYVSSQNDCCFCQPSHGAAAAEHLGENYELIDRIKQNFGAAEISEKLKSLLAISGKVQKSGKHVMAEDVERARQRGATDKEIHDTVLIAAAFCMFNRYVDGLGTWQPADPQAYREMGKTMAQIDYVRPNWDEPSSGEPKLWQAGGSSLIPVKLEDRRWLTFNSPKDYLAFVAQWCSALRPPNHCVILFKCCSPVRIL
jgi:uncharacterized peroxidase-related enzyme